MESAYLLAQPDLEGAVKIGCPQYVTVDELVATVAEVAGKRINSKHIDGPVGVHSRNPSTEFILSEAEGLRTRLKRLTEVCAALEDPSTGLRAGAGVEDENCRLARTPFEEGLRQMIEGYRSLLPPFAKGQESQRETRTCSRR
ncbi:MAG: hypothetical protein ABIK79_16080 [Chloroflexota bacterium]